MAENGSEKVPTYEETCADYAAFLRKSQTRLQELQAEAQSIEQDRVKLLQAMNKAALEQPEVPVPVPPISAQTATHTM